MTWQVLSPTAVQTRGVGVQIQQHRPCLPCAASEAKRSTSWCLPRMRHGFHEATLQHVAEHEQLVRSANNSFKPSALPAHLAMASMTSVLLSITITAAVPRPLWTSLKVQQWQRQWQCSSSSSSSVSGSGRVSTGADQVERLCLVVANPCNW